MSEEKMTVTIRPARFVRAVAIAGMTIVLLGILVQEIRIDGRQLSAFGLAPKFFLNAENTVPNFFSTALLLTAAGILGVIAAAKRRVHDAFARHWKILAILFLLLSLDESASLHELTIQPLRYFLGTGGLLYFAWVIPGMTLILVFAIAFRRFFFHLPVRFRVLFSVAALLCIGGAVGLELLGGLQADLYGERNMAFIRLSTLEELLEMAGVMTFMYALLEYIGSDIGVVRLSAGTESS